MNGGQYLHVQLILFQEEGLPQWLSSKESTCNAGAAERCGFDPWVMKIPWRRAWQPIPIFLPGRPHRQRSLVGYTSCGHKRLRYAEATQHVYTDELEEPEFHPLYTGFNTAVCLIWLPCGFTKLIYKTLCLPAPFLPVWRTVPSLSTACIFFWPIPD